MTNDLPSVGTEAWMQRFDELLDDYGGARGEVAFFNATQQSGMTVRLPRPRLIALQEYVAALVSERDHLAARVRELEGERDAAVNCLTWLKAHLSRFDPPASPNYLVGEIDTALTASKGQP